jgi:hypothetical protein
VCQANTKWATPLKTNSQPKNTVATTPAAQGSTIASTPVTIIKVLRTIDHRKDLLTMTGM